MNLGALMKLGKGQVSPEQFKMLLKAAGIDADFQAVPFPERQATFQRTARLANSDTADVLSITGKGKDGSQIEAILVFSKKQLDTPLR